MPLTASEKKHGHFLPAFLLFLCAVLLVLGVYRRFFLPRARENASFLYPGGEGAVFALTDQALAVASAERAQLLTLEGEEIFSRDFFAAQPFISAGAERCVFGDAGGRELLAVTAEGACETLTFAEDVLFAAISGDGHLTVITGQSGYLGRVWLYSAGCDPLFTYDCGASGFPLCARLSPNGLLAVSCVSPGGSLLQLIDPGSGTVRASLPLSDELLVDLGYLTDGTLCALSERSLLLLDAQGRQRRRVDFQDRLPVDYALCGDFAALLFRDAQGDTLWTVSSAGRVTGRQTLEAPVEGLSLSARRLLILQGSALTLFDSSLSPLAPPAPAENIRCALLSRDGSAVLAGSLGAAVVSLNNR